MSKGYLKLIICLLFVLPSGPACGQPPAQESAEPMKLESLELKDAAVPPASDTIPPASPAVTEPASQGGSFPNEVKDGSALEVKTVPESGALVIKAWEALGKNDYTAVEDYVRKCITLYEAQARREQASLKTFPSAEQQIAFAALNNVATAYFIRGEALMRQNKWPEARAVFENIVANFGFAQYWDPRGWFWKVAEKSQESIVKIDLLLKGEKPAEEQAKPQRPASTLSLFDPGAEMIVDYAKYGRFENAGTKDYKYIITDRAGLARACGEGIFPNTTSVRQDPGFTALKDSERLKGNHWDFLYSDDMQANFYKWNLASEPEGVKQYYIAFLLERAQLWTQAVKAYYAIMVHFPEAYGWTYWHTPWYLGPVAVSKINYILNNHPELGLRLEGAKIKIENSFDNDVRNDIAISNPGKIVKSTPAELLPKREDLSKLKIIQRLGGDRTQLVKYENGHWQLFVQGKPFPVRSVTYAPTKIGQSPDEGTLGNWMDEDFNKNGKIDGPYDAWVDKNRNNIQDADEPAVGDFQLMKEMGVNCIRQYHYPTKINKTLLGDLYKNYGIMTIVGDFLGAYTIGTEKLDKDGNPIKGSGASWYDGTDYTNPEQQKNMLANVRQMVNELKNEPWVLFWLLGNENNYGVANNAKKNPQGYYQFVNQAAKLVHELDPSRPVALCNGDALFLDVFAQEAPQVDIFGANAYRGKEGFVNLWQDIQDKTGKPALITEFGCGAYYEGKPEELADEAQSQYHRGSWQDIEYNMAGYGVGNSLGGIIFEWLDEWWKAYEPSRHDWKGQFYGPFPDGFMHEEWLGIVGQGDGSKSPFLRQLRKSYFTYQKFWISGN